MRLPLTLLAVLIACGVAAAAPRSLEDALAEAREARSPVDDAIDRVTLAMASLPSPTLLKGLKWAPRGVRPEVASAMRFWCAHIVYRRLPGWAGGVDTLAMPDGIAIDDARLVIPAITPQVVPIDDRAAVDKAIRAAIGDSKLSAADRLRLRQLQSIAGDTQPLDDFLAGRSNDVSLALFAVESQANDAAVARASAILWADYLPHRSQSAGAAKPALAYATRMPHALDDRFARLIALATQDATKGHGLTAADLTLFEDIDRAGVATMDRVEDALFGWARDPRPAISRPAMRALFVTPNWGLRMLDGDQAARLHFFTSELASTDAERRAYAAAALLWGRWPTPPEQKTFTPHLAEALAGLPHDVARVLMQADAPQATGGEVSDAYLRWLEQVIAGDDPALAQTAIEQARRYAPGASSGSKLGDVLHALLAKRGGTVNAAWEQTLRTAALALRYEGYPPSPEDLADDAVIRGAVAALPPLPDGPPCGTGPLMAAQGMAQDRRARRVLGRALLGLGDPNEARRIAETTVAMKSLR